MKINVRMTLCCNSYNVSILWHLLIVIMLLDLELVKSGLCLKKNDDILNQRSRNLVDSK